MSKITIRQFNNRPDIQCEDARILRQRLAELNSLTLGSPSLVNVYAGNAGDADRGAIIGLGAEVSSLQLIDESRGVTHRAINEHYDGPAITFDYQGHDTWVKPRLLVPMTIALDALSEWIESDSLNTQINWISAPWPPQPNSI